MHAAPRSSSRPTTAAIRRTYIAQLKNGVRALHAPVDNLESNWAYMLMTALAWNLKAWWALMLPETPGRWQEKHRDEKQWALKMEFKTFLNAFMLLPCQIVRTGHKLVYRLLSLEPAPAYLLPSARCAPLLTNRQSKSGSGRPDPL